MALFVLSLCPFDIPAGVEASITQTLRIIWVKCIPLSLSQRHDGEQHLCFLLGFTPVDREWRSAAHFPLRQTWRLTILSSNIPSSPAYGVFISQLIRYARTCSSYECFILRAARLHLSSSDKDMSWNVWNRPSGSFMVDMGISSNIMKSPSPKCNMPFWDMTIYNDTLNWSDIT